MNTNKFVIILLAILSFVPQMRAAERQDSVIVSLITCWPGAEVYELCGHEAVRIRGVNEAGQPVDSVWNYGTFDFNQPNFIYRFVKGETDYMLSAYPFSWFMPEYQAAGRKVVEQDLNLSPEEATRLHKMLREEALPENRVYRYNYVRDNCATHITERLDEAALSQIIYPDSVHYGTFRNEMRAYHHDYPWYQFGIDMALGSGLDVPLRGRQEMFVPIEMNRKVAEAKLADGRSLVYATRALNEGVPDATLGPTHWSATPMVCCTVFMLMVMVCCWMMLRRRAIWPILYCLWFALLGLAGCLITFLVFFSTHEATAPNILLLWLNPLQFVIAIGVWFRKWRPAVVAMCVCDVIVIGVMLIVWPFQPQSTNPAFFPLIAATLAPALVYAINYRKLSYLKNNISYSHSNEETRNIGARRTGNTRKRSAGRSGASPSRGRNSR